jgi:hypothetical protein
LADLAQLETLSPELKPILITPLYLTRLNFGTVTDNESVRHFQKYTAGIYFNLYPKKNGSITLYINQDIKLPHIQTIHQLQNVYYELTGDVLNASRLQPATNHRGQLKPFMSHGREDRGRGSIGRRRGR